MQFLASLNSLNKKEKLIILHELGINKPNLETGIYPL
jgi:hypothetical protein